ncbi:SRPBCC domain-containing protein [Paractinoplanes maris]|uniref:SRPBCC domain-containing protein n=1 Tax=Paractinoplanes maris TaxID=1734446 RepID=UPI0024C427F4|nr:SRPBCC domain-containing protein [Actinoplanes maris]
MSWTGPGRIDVCDRPHHLLITTEPDTDDEARIEAWLTEEGRGTRLVVEERGLSRERLHFHGAGWQAHLEDLARSLGGEAAAGPESWTELTPAYAEVGIESTTPAVSAGGSGHGREQRLSYQHLSLSAPSRDAEVSGGPTRGQWHDRADLARLDQGVGG